MIRDLFFLIFTFDMLINMIQMIDAKLKLQMIDVKLDNTRNQIFFWRDFNLHVILLKRQYQINFKLASFMTLNLRSFCLWHIFYSKIILWYFHVERSWESFEIHVISRHLESISKFSWSRDISRAFQNSRDLETSREHFEVHVIFQNILRWSFKKFYFFTKINLSYLRFIESCYYMLINFHNKIF
jgi:hypothetical protein